MTVFFAHRWAANVMTGFFFRTAGEWSSLVTVFFAPAGLARTRLAVFFATAGSDMIRNAMFYKDLEGIPHPTRRALDGRAGHSPAGFFVMTGFFAPWPADSGKCHDWIFFRSPAKNKSSHDISPPSEPARSPAGFFSRAGQKSSLVTVYFAVRKKIQS